MDSQQIFYIGLGLGCAPFLILWLASLNRGRVLKKEQKSLRKMLQQKLETEADFMSSQKKEIDDLKALNENLRVSLKTLTQKSNQKDLIHLDLYQKAIERMNTRVPGFAPAWQTVLHECEAEMEGFMKGTKAFVTRIIPSRLFKSITGSNIENDESNQL